MMRQQIFRTSLAMALGLVALGFVSQAHAEPGEGGSLIPPDLEAAQASSALPGADEPKADGDAVEQTASIPADPRPTDPRLRLRAADAARASTLAPLIARHAAEHGIPFELADAVVRLESRYNPAARNGANLGLTQIKYQTARSLGYDGPPAGLFDAETNLRYGLKYLAQAYRLAGGDTCGAILRYQFGLRTETMKPASRAYCARVKALYASID